MSDDTPKTPERVAFDWWAHLTGEKGDRGARARLRRASTLTDVLAEPAAIDLALRMERACVEAGWQPHGPDRIAMRGALVAGVLAHVTENASTSLGRALGGVAKDDAPMSPLRLRRLLTPRDAGEALVIYRRAVTMLKGRAPVGDLARTLLAMADPASPAADRARIRLAFAYHGEGDHAPSGNAPTPETAA